MKIYYINKFFSGAGYISDYALSVCKNIMLKDPEFVSSLFAPDTFFKVYHKLFLKITDAKSKNRVSGSELMNLQLRMLDTF